MSGSMVQYDLHHKLNKRNPMGSYFPASLMETKTTISVRSMLRVVSRHPLSVNYNGGIFLRKLSDNTEQGKMWPYTLYFTGLSSILR